MALFETVILLDTRAAQPAATAVGAGTLFSVTDEGNVLERSNGTTWDNYGPTVSSSTTGNAATATALQTARTINGTSFNGTANITVTAAAGTLTGATLAAGVLASSLTSVGTLATLTVTAAIVGSVTGASGSTTGNAATATALATARAINGVSFDGTAAITVTAAAGTLTGTTLAATVVSSSLTSVGTLATLTVTAPIVGSVTGASGSSTGNAATATALATPRAINGVNFDGTAAITVTAAAGTLTGATLAAGVTASSLTSVGTLATLTVTAAIVGSVTGASGSTSGNAATATALATGRAINGVTFDGTAPITVTAAAATLTGTLADATLSANVPLKNAANTFTAAQNVTLTALAQVGTDGVVLENTTLSTSGVTIQYSPQIRFVSHVWNSTTTAADNSSVWTIVSAPFSAAAPSGRLNFIHSLAGASSGIIALQINAAGTVTAGGTMVATGNSQCGASSAFTWSGRAAMFSPANGQVNVNVQNSSAGVGLDVVTDTILKIRTRAQTGYATVDALGYRVSGVAIDTEPVGFFNAGNTSTALTLDFANSRHQRCTLTGNVTFTLSNPTDGARYVIRLDTGAGAFTAAWPAAVLWAGGIAPVITVTASNVDVIVLIYSSDTSKYYGSFSQNY